MRLQEYLEKMNEETLEEGMNSLDGIVNKMFLDMTKREDPKKAKKMVMDMISKKAETIMNNLIKKALKKK